jgi:poly-gamma-glutamate synthesis protein (capsule biosynthesis protein)
MLSPSLRRIILAALGALAAGALIISVARSRAPKPTVTLAAVGDVFFARGVGKQIERHGPDWPFAEVRDTIQSADLAFCNLECPLSTGGIPQRRRYLFRADPKFAATLHSAGFDVVSLANNHTMDYGRTALLDTLRATENADLVALGAGENLPAAQKLRCIEKDGLKIGFLSYTDLPSDGMVRLPNKPTVSALAPELLAAQITAASRKCDTLIVSFHWGVEYMKRPTERQRRLAHLCVDHGADLILGHHPHVLQPIETYKNRPIIYSMGAFLWDAKIFNADKTAIYLIELTRDSASVKKTLPAESRGCRPVLRTHPPELVQPPS